jgi:hypothetical protein
MYIVALSCVPAEEQVETWLREFDLDVDGTISEHEFVTGITKWTKRVAQDKAFYQAQQASIGDTDFWAAKSNDAKAVNIYHPHHPFHCLCLDEVITGVFTKLVPWPGAGASGEGGWSDECGGVGGRGRSGGQGVGSSADLQESCSLHARWSCACSSVCRPHGGQHRELLSRFTSSSVLRRLRCHPLRFQCE